jgi:hypothetical protein
LRRFGPQDFGQSLNRQTSTSKGCLEILPAGCREKIPQGLLSRLSFGDTGQGLLPG